MNHQTYNSNLKKRNSIPENMQSDSKQAAAQYVITLLYAPCSYDKTKNQYVRIIGDFNSWQEETCFFDKTLGMYYFDLKLPDLTKPITFKFVSHCVGKCGSYQSHYECSSIYAQVEDENGNTNNCLDLSKLAETQVKKLDQQGLAEASSSKPTDQEMMLNYNDFIKKQILKAQEDKQNKQVKKAAEQTQVLQEPILFIPENRQEIYNRLKNESLRVCQNRDGRWVVGSHSIDKLNLKLDEKENIEIYYAKYQRYPTDGPLIFKFLVGEERGENYFKSIIYHEHDFHNNQSISDKSPEAINKKLIDKLSSEKAQAAFPELTGKTIQFDFVTVISKTDCFVRIEGQ